MRRHVFYRDFTMGRAVVLAGLIGLAGLLGEVQASGGATETPPALLHKAAQTVETDAPCNWGGIDL